MYVDGVALLTAEQNSVNNFLKYGHSQSHNNFQNSAPVIAVNVKSISTSWVALKWKMNSWIFIAILPPWCFGAS